MSALEFIYKQPVFTHEELTQYLVANGTTNANTRREILAYHINKKHIQRIRRGLFARIPLTSRSSAESFIIDPFLIAGRITKDAVLAYHTAFDIHGIAYSMYNQFTFLSQSHIKPFKFQQSKYICLSPHKNLIEKNRIDFEVITIDRQGMDVKVTSLERSIVDALDRPNYAGGWEEIWRSISHIKILNLDRILEYAKLLNNATTYAKLGFFLEQHRDQFNIDEKLLNELEQMKPEGLHYIERSKRESGKVMKRWNLVVPVFVVTRAWEEPFNEDV